MIFLIKNWWLYPLLKDKFSEIWKLISKITLKVINLKKTRKRVPEFSQYQRKSPSFQNTNVEKHTFSKTRFKGIHWFDILKISAFHEDSIAKDFIWIASLVFEKLPFYLCHLRNMGKLTSYPITNVKFWKKASIYSTKIDKYTLC